MTKSDLIRKMYAKHPHLYQQDLDRIVNLVLDEITEVLNRGGRIELRGFGAFSTKVGNGRVGRNPSTGSAIVVEAKRAPLFRTSKQLHRRLNHSEP